VKIAAFSDVHLRDMGSFQPYNKVDENGLTLELNNILRGLDFVADTIAKVKPDAVFLPGDLYHTPESLTASVIYASSIGLSKVKAACDELGIPFYIMPGNHDILNDKLGINTISTLSGYAELLFENQVLDFGSCKVGVVQFNSDKGVVAQNLKEISEQCDVLVTHLDFKGARYETGKMSDSVIEANLPIPVISGDIHLPQKVGSVHYIGSLVQNRFNRTDMEGIGGVLVYDTDTKKFTRHKNTWSKHYVKIEDMSQMVELDPEYCVLQVRCPNLNEKDLKDLGFFEYVHLPIPETVSQVQVGASIVNVEKPEEALRNFVTENRPDALFLLNEIIGAAHE
jgi:hypothetical protein